MGYIAVFDDAIIRFIAQFAGRSAAFDQMVHDVADANLLKGGLFMAYFWCLWLRSDGDVAGRRQRVLVAIAGALLAVVLSRLAQLVLPFHVRPLHAGDPNFVLPIGVNPATLSRWNSFPSDHATLFWALSLAVWYESRRLGLVAMAWTLVVICLPRIYLGFHYPSDVIGGIVLGAVIMTTTRRSLRRLPLLAWVIRWESRHRAAFYLIAFLTTYEISILFYDLRQLAVDSIRLVDAMIVMRA